MKRNIRKTGTGSYMIVIPKIIVEMLKLKLGDAMDVKVKGEQIVIDKIKGDKNES